MKKLLNHQITKTIAKVLGILLVLIILTSLYLKIYTHHGTSIFTPSFKGLSLEQAKKLAKDKHLEILIIDSVFEGYYQPGTVVDQTPSANFPVKRNRKIFIVIKAFNQPMVKMPNLVDYSLIQAQAILENNGLRVGNISFVPNPNFEHLVAEQRYKGNKIAVGTQLPKGSKIDLLVYQNTSKNTSIPDLIGLTYDQAIKQITRQYLNLGKVYFNSNILTQKDSSEAIIYKQSPQEGSSSNYGQKIDIWLMQAD